jgi:ligand-binding sensor domain-containing protein
LLVAAMAAACLIDGAKAADARPETEKEPANSSRGAVDSAAVLRGFLDTAKAVDSNKAVSQYSHNQWGAEQGFPGAAYAITQTPDGYLWVGTENGLVRFDGISFRVFSQATSSGDTIGSVRGLISDAEGNLWLRLDQPRLLRYRDGAFHDELPDRNRLENAITAICLGNHAEALFSGHANDVVRYSKGKFVQLVPQAGTSLALVLSIAETPEGTVWLGTREAGLISINQGRISNVVEGLPDRKINCLLPVGTGELWVGTDYGIARWTGSNLTLSGVPAALSQVQILAMLRDSAANIWVGTSNGLYRIDSRGVLWPEERANAPVTTLYEDREGNLWVGGAQGIERFRSNAFLTYSLPEGRPAESPGPLYSDTEGRTWFASSAGGLYWLKNAQIESVANAGLNTDVVYSIAGSGNEVWLGRQQRGLTRLRRNGSVLTADTYTQADGLAQNTVAAVFRSRDGTIWAGTLNGGVSRFSEGKFTTYTTANGLASNTISAIEESPTGTMFFATPNGLSALTQHTWRTYTQNDGLPPGNVNCLLEDSNAVLWIGTAKGLAFLDSHGIQVPREMPDAFYQQIFGIAEDRTGYLWIAASNRVLRVKRDALLQGTVSQTDVREYGPRDGLSGTQLAKRYRSLIRDPMGRIWFSMNRGISVVDPARLSRSSVPVPVHIEAISADGRQISLQGSVHIPAARQRVTFTYAGVSLAAPERVKFRYMLDRFDQSWSEPLSTHDAVYNNLGPGPYRFRVIASNASGVWSEPADIRFEIEPALWQAWWFRLACAAAFMLAALVFFRHRMHLMASRLNLRFEERLAERTRIAQELHDTLLQGILSASMQLYVATERVPAESSAKPLLNSVLELMGKVVEEGRNALRGLRLDDGKTSNLEQVFLRIPQEFGLQNEIAFRVIVEGRPRPLHPLVRDDVYRFGREAVMNAFRHSHAKNVEVELEYARHHLRMLVRDDGSGINPVTLQSGRNGDAGLAAMREQAERTGFRFHVWSSASAGTEVEFSIPGHIAFPTEASHYPIKWFTRKSAKTAHRTTQEPKHNH